MNNPHSSKLSETRTIKLDTGFFINIFCFGSKVNLYMDIDDSIILTELCSAFEAFFTLFGICVIRVSVSLYDVLGLQRKKSKKTCEALVANRLYLEFQSTITNMTTIGAYYLHLIDGLHSCIHYTHGD